MLGTDKFVPYVVAGFAEHQEMQLLSQAKLISYEIISAVTVNAARCLGKEAEIGTIETGKKADIILTEKNPLDNLHTISCHLGVIKHRMYCSKDKCNNILAEIKKRVSR